MSDLIDRKKALDEISKIDTSIIPSGWVKGYVDETIKETQRIIRTIPSAEPEQRWIPVTEALPINGVDVIVSVLDNSGDTPYRFTSVGWCTPNGLAHDIWEDPEHRVDSEWWIVGEVRKNDIIVATYLDEAELCEEDLGVTWNAYRKERK